MTFTVGYTPVEYGKVKTGKLIIQTAEYYWNFAVKGTFPKYIPPKPDHSSLDNRLDNQKKLAIINKPGTAVASKSEVKTKLALPKPL